MDLNEYIRKNYKAPNKEVLKTLGASDELISYLMETPWNTNLEVVNAISSGGGGDDDEWTTIRLHRQIMDAGDPTAGYIFATHSEEDINKYMELYQLKENNQHPIINKTISINNNTTNLIQGIFTQEGGGGAYSMTMITCAFDNNFTVVYVPPESETSQYYGGPGLITYYSLDIAENDYIDIKYKAASSYYTTAWSIGAEEDLIIYVEPETSIIIPEDFSGQLSDGTNTYSAGDTITFNSDMQFQLVGE